jgi:hypothetical protein
MVYGQGASQTLSGTVADASGAVIPGADVVAKHAGSGVATAAVTNDEGVFSMPSLPIGTYTVTVTLQGFKTVVISNVVLTSAAGANVKATMEVGAVSENVTVSSASEIVQTQSSAIAQTINTKQITQLPLTSRSAMDFVNMLPGVTTANGNRQAVINGLPRGTINITLDGVNVQDNTLRTSDGFFAIVSPRLDAIEEVTVSTASQDSGDSGQGAVQVKFVTRSGTNNFTGSGYYFGRREWLNANTWFNNRDGVKKAKLQQDQRGFRVGGPIMLPGFDGHNKAFFFFNYEQLRQPNEVTRNNRNVLSTSAQAGNYCYTGNCVNVLSLAAANGQIASVDPTVGKVLSDIRSAVNGGSLADIDPNVQVFTFNVPVQTKRDYPTFSIDYNVTQDHRAKFAYNYQKFSDYPDTLNRMENAFPGFPIGAGQTSIRLGWSGSMRSTLGRNLVNEARLGYSGAPVRFFDEITTDMYSSYQGFELNFPTVGSGLTGPAPLGGFRPQSRNANSLLIDDTVNWLKGSHSFSFGGAFTQYDIWAKDQRIIPSISFATLTNDPASAMFVAGNFPGASATQIGAASSLYALLTGRVSAISADARLDADTGEYVYVGPGLQEGRLREYEMFVQDRWRIRSNMTLNLGLRYALQNPFQPRNSLYSTANIAQVCGISGANGDNACNLFQPGKLPGQKSTYDQYTEGSKAHNTDLNNFAPSVGLAWTPTQKEGALGMLMGREGDFVIRGGWNRAYSRPGLNDYTGRLNANPGIQINADRTSGNGLLGTPPVLLRDQSQLGPPTIPTKPSYPLPSNVSSSINTFDPNLQVPSADSFSAGIQRSVGKDMAVEVRYVGTRSRDGWSAPGAGVGGFNYNEFNITDNGFLQEFRTAQANLTANIAAGRGNSFAYMGPGTGTSPLPIFLAYYNAQPTANAGNAALYTGGNWTNATFLGFLAKYNPNPFGFASTNGTNGLQGNATFRGNALTAGLPANFFIANPDVSAANVVKNYYKTRYNALQLELRRRYAQGLQFNASYAFGHEYDSQFASFFRDEYWLRPSGNTGDIPHAFKINVVYDLPFGQGRRWGSTANGVMNRIIAGWQVGVFSRLQSGTPVNLGNVRLVGMSKDDVQDMFKLRFDDANKRVFMLPQDVIDNTILAFNTSATSATGYSNQGVPTGRYFAPANGPDCIEIGNGNYGDCGIRALVLNGPMFQQHDLRIAKRTSVVGRTNIEFAAQMLNVFNHPNFLAVGGIGGTTIDGYRVTGLQGQDTARIIQLEVRFNW